MWETIHWSFSSNLEFYSCDTITTWGMGQTRGMDVPEKWDVPEEWTSLRNGTYQRNGTNKRNGHTQRVGQTWGMGQTLRTDNPEKWDKPKEWTYSRSRQTKMGQMRGMEQTWWDKPVEWDKWSSWNDKIDIMLYVNTYLSAFFLSCSPTFSDLHDVFSYTWVKMYAALPSSVLQTFCPFLVHVTSHTTVLKRHTKTISYAGQHPDIP